MGKLNLLDLECILIERGMFNIEKNGEKILNISSGELWEQIHKEKIIKAEFFDEDIIYIKLQNNEIILFL
ncbi:hypothetical protein [uncultured Clostridium sp.]|uniref:hypothetical protein n=1 Tax=uncultured Clostridium sp. TaxID=59620 RepID=UPI002626FC24|nr:hypothetical protein [uncultured Clostridium sp.]